MHDLKYFYDKNTNKHYYLEQFNDYIIENKDGEKCKIPLPEKEVTKCNSIIITNEEEQQYILSKTPKKLNCKKLVIHVNDIISEEKKYLPSEQTQRCNECKREVVTTNNITQNIISEESNVKYKIDRVCTPRFKKTTFVDNLLIELEKCETIPPIQIPIQKQKDEMCLTLNPFLNKHRLQCMPSL